jgi:hypothetical protein
MITRTRETALCRYSRKVCYTSSRAAERALAAIQRCGHIRRGDVGRLVVFCCAHCHRWHLGRGKPGD